MQIFYRVLVGDIFLELETFEMALCFRMQKPVFFDVKVGHFLVNVFTVTV